MTKLLHVISDSVYTAKFIEFVNLNWGQKDHFFLIWAAPKSQFAKCYRNYSNCSIVSGSLAMFWLLFLNRNVDVVVFHQLNQPRTLAFVSLFLPGLLRKAVWSFWGGDVYFYREKAESLKNAGIFRVLSHVGARVPVITGYMPGDFLEIKRAFRVNARYIHSKYPSPIDLGAIHKFVGLKRKDSKTRVLVGNSGDPSNQHLRAFEELSRFRNDDIEIVAVLSYGGTPQYVEKVILHGRKTFGTRFIPITEFLKFDDYLELIAGIDVCCFFHDRQQGLGNLFLFVVLMKKVFISNKTTPFHYYRSKGVKLFAVEDIHNLNIGELAETKGKFLEQSAQIILEETDLKSVASEWQDVFDSLSGVFPKLGRKPLKMNK